MISNDSYIFYSEIKSTWLIIINEGQSVNSIWHPRWPPKYLNQKLQLNAKHYETKRLCLFFQCINVIANEIYTFYSEIN